MDQPTNSANRPQASTTDRLRNYPYEAQERAAIYEYEAGMTRQQAEERVIEEMAKQNRTTKATICPA